MTAVESAVVIGLTKRCPACGETKPVSGFYRSYLRGPQFRSGYTSYCKACDAVKRKQNKRCPKRSAQRRAWNFNGSLKSKYGITEAQAREMLRQQFGLCANRGCGRPLSFDVERGAPDRAQVDHCHKTMRVRGVLCRRCNTGAAIIERDENIYLGLLEYLTR